MNDSPATYPPLSAWVVALALVLCAGAAALFQTRLNGAPASSVFLNFNVERLQALGSQSAGSDAITIVMLGTSAFKYATRDDPELARSITEMAGKDVRVIRIVNNWGVFGDFEPVVPHILALKPDVVLLEENLLSNDRPWWRHLLLLVDNLGWRLKGDGEWHHRPEDPQLVQFDRPCWHVSRVHSVDEQQRRKDEWVVLDPNGPSPRSARVFIQQVLAEGGRVYLVGVPRRPDFESTLGRLALGAEFQAVPTPGGIETWWPPALGRDLYCDVTHVSKEGRDLYSDWLERQLAGAVRGD